MKLFILACCLLVLAASSPVPMYDHEPVNSPPKNLASKFSPASSPGSSESAGAHSAISSPSGHGITQNTSSKSGSGSGSRFGSASDHDSGTGFGIVSGTGRALRSKRSEERRDSASSKEW